MTDRFYSHVKNVEISRLFREMTSPEAAFNLTAQHESLFQNKNPIRTRASIFCNKIICCEEGAALSSLEAPWGQEEPAASSGCPGVFRGSNVSGGGL